MVESCLKCLAPLEREAAGQLAKEAAETFQNLAHGFWDNANEALRKVSSVRPELEVERQRFIQSESQLIMQASEAATVLETFLADAVTIDCDKELESTDTPASYCPRAEHLKRVLEEVLTKLENDNE